MKRLSFSFLDQALKPLILGFIGLCVLTLVLRVLSFGDPSHRLTAWAEEAAKPEAAPKATSTATPVTTEIKPDLVKKPETKTDLTAREGQADFVKPTKTDEDLVDITTFSKSEIELLQSLRARRALLDKKTEEMDQRERTVAALEATLDSKLKTMETIKDDIETIYKNIETKVTELHKSQDEQIASLVRIYEKMKPESAAAIMNNLELTILLDVVRGMKEAKLAPILAKMDVKKATFVTAALAEKTPVPEDAKTLMASMNTPKAKPEGQPQGQ
jgi:flagellar motility protein MotE (MotC chaperone)